MSHFTLKLRKKLASWVNALADRLDRVYWCSPTLVFVPQFNIVAQYSGACYKAHDVDPNGHEANRTSIVGWILIGLWVLTFTHYHLFTRRVLPQLHTTLYASQFPGCCVDLSGGGVSLPILCQRRAWHQSSAQLWLLEKLSPPDNGEAHWVYVCIVCAPICIYI